MDNRKEIDETAREINNAVAAADKEREVDDILNDILGSDGSYKTDFSDMFSKYNVDPSLDLKDIMTSAGLHRRDYAAEADAAIAASRTVESRKAQKVSSDVRGAYDREPESAVRPEFTPDGNVLYPSYGVGESEQRVVFDADWEVQAKEEAARLEKLRRGNMLRGDSDYARNFRFSGAEDRHVPKRTPYPGFIDPLEETPNSGHREVYSADAAGNAENTDSFGGSEEKKGKDAKKSFFQEGFSVGQKRDEAVSGKTENDDDSEIEGLSKEIAQKVDSRVIEAFANELKAGNEFKGERWQDIVDKAQKRKEQLEAGARKEEARQRSRQKLDEQRQRIARIEEDIAKNPRTDINFISYYTEDKFEAINPEDAAEEPKPAYEAENASAYTPDVRFDSPAALEVDAEKLSPYEVKSLNESAMGSDETIKKSSREKIQFFIKTHFSKEGFRRFAVNNFPQKSDSTGEKVRKVVRSLSFVALVCALIYLLIYYHNYRERIKFLRDSEIDISELDNIPDYELDNAWAQMRAKYPDVDFPEGMNIKFANLYAISRDVVGWLKIENTDISTVLLQTNNDDYYLYRDIYGSRSRYGNPYVKSSCNMGREGLSKNTIIYGHNTHDKLIFNKLENYMTVQGYLNAPIITLDTLYETTKWKIFAVMLTNADPADDNGNIFTYLYSSFSSDDAFMGKMKEIQARSMIHTGVDVQPGDKTLMLYTCYRNIFSSGRLVIVARQLREGESEAVNSSLVYYDSSAIFPQAYYDKKNGVSTTTKKESENTESKSPENTASSSEPDETPLEEPSNTENGEPGGARDDENVIPAQNDQHETGAAGEAGAAEGSQSSENASDAPAQTEENAA